MRIVCPMCGFSREVDEARIPPRAQMATCPKCHHKFRFRVVDDLDSEPAGGLVPGARPNAPNAVDPSDPLSAQHAAAAEMWKRLQGRKPEGRDASGKRGGLPFGLPKFGRGRPEAGSPKDVPPEGVPPEGASGKDVPPKDASAGDVPSGAESSGGASPQGDLRENGRGFGRDGSAGAEGGPEEGSPSPVPFENLTHFGFFPGLFSTIRMILFTPGAFFDSMPHRGGLAKPVAFYVLLSEFMVLCQCVWGMLSIRSMAQYAGSPMFMNMGVGLAGASILPILVLAPLVVVLRLMLLTGVVHLLLRLFHASGGGAEATFRVLSYSSAAFVAGLVPFVGPLIGGLWSLGVAVVGLRHVHKTSLALAIFSALLPLLLIQAAAWGFLQGLMKAV